MFAMFCYTHKMKVDHIKKNVSHELKAAGYPVNDESLYWSYKGLLEAWLEDEEGEGFSDKKIKWIASLKTEIDFLSTKLTPEQLDPNL